MPSKPNDGKLYAQIIEGLGHQAPYTRRGTDLEILGLRLLHRHPPRMMIVDEVHHLLAGTVREQRQSLNQLKFLSNELRMPVVALGTSEALYAMQADPQIASRFEPVALPRWRESAGLREFVVNFGRLLPLWRPSPFGDKDVIQKLMAYSGPDRQNHDPVGPRQPSWRSAREPNPSTWRCSIKQPPPGSSESPRRKKPMTRRCRAEASGGLVTR